MEEEYLKHITRLNPPETGALVRRYWQDVWQYAYLLTRKEQLAEAIAHDTFVRAFRAIDRFRGQVAFRSWLFKFVRKAASHYPYTALLRKAAMSRLPAAGRRSPSAEPESGNTAKAHTGEVWAAVMQLPVIYRDILVLHGHYGLGAGELAKLLDIAEGSVNARLRRARAKLGKRMREAVPTRRSDETPEAERLLGKLESSPFAEIRMPSEYRIAIIQKEASGMPSPTVRRRKAWIVWSGAGLTFLMFLLALGYAYETPGGIADWRYSRAIGMSGTMRIPIGHTPEEAVQKVRDSTTSMQVIHEAYLDGGALLFWKRNTTVGGTDLQIEFVRKTWLGWKWVMGGGYGMSAAKDRAEALNFMSMPRFPDGVAGPFPIVFGQLSSPLVTGVRITIGGPDAGAYPALVATVGGVGRVWFAELPKTAAAPYGVEALDDRGAVLARKSFEDPRDIGSLPMPKS